MTTQEQDIKYNFVAPLKLFHLFETNGWRLFLGLGFKLMSPESKSGIR